jgi:hypothetical protein
MKTELYKKVWIKSEADLPKEDGVYFCYYKKYGENSTHFYKNNLARIQRWLTELDWYLQPIEQIEQPAVQLTDEEISSEFDRRLESENSEDRVGFEEGAKWCRSQSQASLRDELVKFVEYFEKEATENTDPNCSIDGDQYLLNWIPNEENIDEYLKTKQ